MTPPTRFQEPRSHLIVYAHTPHCDATGSRAAKDSATLLLEVDLVQLIKNNAPWEEEEEKKNEARWTAASGRRPGAHVWRRAEVSVCWLGAAAEAALHNSAIVSTSQPQK